MSGTKEKIWLVVEDIEDDYLLLERALHKVAPDIKLPWVENGCEAKRYLLGEGPFQDRGAFPQPSLILTDLNMPRCDGFELLKWLRQQPEFGALPCVVFSSSDQPSDVNLAGNYGADGYLTKPARPDQLLEMLRRLCEQFR